MTPRKLLEQVVRDNAAFLLSADPAQRRAAMACILAQADDYAETRAMKWKPASGDPEPERERLRTAWLNKDLGQVTAARRRRLEAALSKNGART